MNMSLYLRFSCHPKDDERVFTHEEFHIAGPIFHGDVPILECGFKIRLK